MFDKITRIIVIILLGVLVLGLAAVIITQQIQAGAERARAERCAAAIAAADLSNLMTNYENDVYNNSSVDNINKQIFKANEYQVIVAAHEALILAACLP